MKLTKRQRIEVRIFAAHVCVADPVDVDGVPCVPIEVADGGGDVAAVQLPVQVAPIVVEDLLRRATDEGVLQPHDALGWVMALEEAACAIRDHFGLVRVPSKPRADEASPVLDQVVPDACPVDAGELPGVSSVPSVEKDVRSEGAE